MGVLCPSLTILVLLLQVPCTLCAFNSTVETDLRTSLLSSYGLGVRPSAVVDLSVLFNIITINELNIRSQTLSVSGWFVMNWYDDRLVWDVTNSLYSDTNFLFFTQSEIWRPTVIVDNSVSDLSVIEDDNVPFRVFSTGQIMWNPPGIYTTNCDIDITYYPFDTQACSVSLRTVGYNIRELNLTLFSSGLKTSSFQKNGEWTLVSASAARTESVDTTDAETYATLQFTFTVQRRTEYYGLNVILPVIVLALLSAFVFLLPPESGEKMGYALTVLLSIVVFLSLIADQIPTTSKSISILSIYISIIVLLSGLSILLTLVTLDIYYRDDRIPIPGWLLKLSKNVLIPFVCWGRSSSPKNKIVTESHVERFSRQCSKKTDKSGRNADKNASSFDEDDLSWVDIAKMFDVCWLRVYIIIFIIITLVCFMIMFT